MALETRTLLSEEMLSELQDLIQYNLDSRDGFRHAAENLEEIAVANMFVQMADERDRQAFELQSIVNNNGEQPTREGSYMAAAHRTWMDIRQALGGGLQAVLAEAERGEDYIKGEYEKALKQFTGSAVQDVLTQHYAQVKAAHDRVRAMRDAHK